MLYAVLSTDTQNTLKYHLVSVKPSFTVKNDRLYAPDRIYRKEIGKVRYVTNMLHDYRVRNGVGHCVKNRSYSSPNLDWKPIDSIAGYLTFSTNIKCYEACHWWQFYCSARRYTDAYCIQHSPTAMVQNTHLPFFLGYGPKLPRAELQWQRNLGSHTPTAAWVVNNKTE